MFLNQQKQGLTKLRGYGEVTAQPDFVEGVEVKFWLKNLFDNVLRAT
jgi:hypothetical protein